jgi:hypothetical protein
MEWLWTLALALILVGPIVWGLTKGRNRRAPEVDDPDGAAGIGALISRLLAPRR